jgi:hypothetical protein
MSNALSAEGEAVSFDGCPNSMLTVTPIEG